MAKVEMYTKTFCPYCDKAKALLQQKGVEFETYNLNDEPARMAEMQERNPGARTVPQIFINDQAIGGFDDRNALNEKGELDGLLAANNDQPKKPNAGGPNV